MSENWSHTKSWTTLLLDVFRYGLAIALAALGVWWAWRWHWGAGLVAVLPAYVISLNIAGFATLPLYLITPENRLKAKMYRAFQRGDFEQGRVLTDEFTRRFKVILPPEFQGGNSEPPA